jgi:hypothetical protein
MMYSAKRLDKTNMDKVQALERKLGYCLVAWEAAPKAAPVPEAELAEIKALEKEMGATLVAYDCECKKQ